jgi:AcrR family transcriptional regulator
MVPFVMSITRLAEAHEMNPATPPATEERTLRADARRNREAIIEAARARFAEEGLEAQIDDIARDAGVGVGTVYRHFPTKEDLVEALAMARFSTLAELAREAIADPDPWRAFSGYMRRSAELQAQDLALSEAMASRPGMMGMAAERAGMPELMDELVERAKKAGVVRADADWQDVPMMICGLGRITQGAEEVPFMNWERLLAVLLDGIRAPGATPLPKR